MSAAEVYRAFDGSGRLLYVGCSGDADTRLRYHEGHAPWWVFHESIERTPFDDYDEALAAEAEAIATEHPRWNMQGRSDDHPDGVANTLYRAPWLDYELDVSRRLRRLRQDIGGMEIKLRKTKLALRAVQAEAAMIRTGAVDDAEDIEAAS